MQATTARACWCRAPGQCELQQEALPALKPDDVLVRATHGAVSRGTESLVLAGRVPASEHARMRCPHMGGSFEFPVKYGYVSVGVVEACGKDVEHLRNARVFCLHPHQDAYVVPAADVRVVPPATPSARAVLAPNLETAINVVWDAGIGVGDRVAVVGAGVVGCLVAWVAARIPGVDVLLVDVDGRRRRVAEALGASFGLAGALGDGAGDRDVVVHARRRRGRRGGGARAGRRRGRRGRGVVAREHRRAPPARRAVPRAAADAQKLAGREPAAVEAAALGLYAADESRPEAGGRRVARRALRARRRRVRGPARRAAARLRRARRGGRAVPPRRLFVS